MVGLIGIVLPEVETYPIQYINASNITTTGATVISGTITNISDINGGFYNVSEGNAQPFYVIVNFTNITNFSFLEVKAKYFSSSGTPSSHVVDLQIWCDTDKAYEDLFFLENDNEWRYFTRQFPDSMHFIDAQGNVSIRFNHPSNGNVNHLLYIDTVRLIIKESFEQNIVYLTQHFNTTTTGGSGVSDLLNLTINTNKNWQGYNITNLSELNMTGKINMNVSDGAINISTNLNWTYSATARSSNNTVRVFTNNILVHELRANGIGNWWIYGTDAIMRGWIGYSTPNGNPGIAFRNSTESNTSVFVLTPSGLCFASGTSTASPACQVYIGFDGNIKIVALAGVGNRPICASSDGTLIICP